MDDTQAAKVIRFPGKHNPAKQNELTEAAPAPAPAPVATTTRLRTGVGVSLLAIALATVAVNQYAHRNADLARDGDAGRAVASVVKHPERDAAWEKNLAERLAQPGALRVPAQIGRGATPGEELRYGLLEDHYVIDWRVDQTSRRIRGISLGKAEPVAVDGARMLARYGSLFNAGFKNVRLVDRSAPDQGRVTESFELLDGAGAVISRAKLAYDAERRLISVENTPVQI